MYLKIDTSRFDSLSKKNELHIVGETKKEEFQNVIKIAKPKKDVSNKFTNGFFRKNWIL